MQNIQTQLQKHFLQNTEHDIAHVKFKNSEYIGVQDGKQIKIFQLEGGYNNLVAKYLFNGMRQMPYPRYNRPRFRSFNRQSRPLSFYSGYMGDIVENFIKKEVNSKDKLNDLTKSNDYPKIKHAVMNYLIDCSGIHRGSFMPYSPLIRAVPIINGGGMLPDRYGADAYYPSVTKRTYRTNSYYPRLFSTYSTCPYQQRIYIGHNKRCKNQLESIKKMINK